MSYCIKCGKEIEEGAAFCSACGASVKKETTTAPQQNEIPAAPTEPLIFNEEFDREEREFLENTHRLLRWEHKAWSIASKVWIISGIVFAAIFLFVAFIGIIIAAVGGEYSGGFLVGMSLVYAILFGGMYIAFGIVSKKAAEKLPQYINSVYTDFSLAYNRCGNIGMLIFSVLLGAVSPIFFIINFVRMKANRDVIERIMKNQNIQG